jgi:hypothetical protein
MTLGILKVMSKPLVEVQLTLESDETKVIGVTDSLLDKTIDLGKIKKVNVQSYNEGAYLISFKGIGVDTRKLYEVNVVDRLNMEFRDSTVQATLSVKRKSETQSE